MLPLAVTLTAALTAVALAVAGCSSSDSSTPKAGPSAQVTGGSRPVVSTVVLGHVAGNLHQPNRRIFAQHRKPLLREVGAAADAWIDGGFVGVHYPRSGFGTAFASFTAPARSDAQRQKTLMTNWRLRKRIDGVEVRKRRVTVDVLAPHGRPAGATARVHLVFTTTGRAHRRVVVDGRLFLSPDDHGRWKVFGYDVTQGGAR